MPLVSLKEKCRQPSARGRRAAPKRGRPRRSRSAPAVIMSDITNKRKRWSNQSMCLALEAVKEKRCSISQAVREYGVPYTTLHDRLSGKITHGINPCPRPYLSKCEENDLSTFLVEVAKAGYGKSRQQVLSLASNAAHDKGLLNSGDKLSNGWYYRFINRNQQLVLRKGDPTANVRMDSVNKEIMDNYFSLLKDTLEKYDLLNNPSQIYNVDEMDMPLDHRPPKIVTTKGQKKVRCRTSGNKSQITVIA